MNIAVLNEVSARSKNGELLAALEGRGHGVYNCGMDTDSDLPELTYIHTGLMAGLIAATGSADLIVGGCGTGEGFLISSNQYPGIICGLVTNPLDGWLYAQINGGNCIALPFLLGYGWAGDVHLRFIFDRYFSVESGCGYPEHRKESQRESRRMLEEINVRVRKGWSDILESLDRDLVKKVASFPDFIEFLDRQGTENRQLIDQLKEYGV